MKCELGDLAKIIHSVNPSNLGKTVLVDDYIGHFSQGETFDFRGIGCRAPVTDHYWWISAEYGLANQLGETPKAYIADTWLDPIRPINISKTEEEVIDDRLTV
jgi:hypothetical protein